MLPDFDSAQTLTGQCQPSVRGKDNSNQRPSSCNAHLVAHVCKEEEVAKGRHHHRGLAAAQPCSRGAHASVVHQRTTPAAARNSSSGTARATRDHTAVRQQAATQSAWLTRRMQLLARVRQANSTVGLHAGFACAGLVIAAPDRGFQSFLQVRVQLT